MKKSFSSICIVVLLAMGSASQAQQVKFVTDTAGLHTESARLNNDITGLNAQLIIAKSNLSAYLSQAGTASVNTASSKVNKAASTTTGKVIPVVEKAKQDHENASQASNQRLNSLHDRIFILSDEISRKQQRLQQLAAPEVL